MQGIPAYSSLQALECPGSSGGWPLLLEQGALSNSQMRKLAGNAMHKATAGAIATFALCHLHKHPKPRALPKPGARVRIRKKTTSPASRAGVEKTQEDEDVSEDGQRESHCPSTPNQHLKRRNTSGSLTSAAESTPGTSPFITRS